MKQFFKSKVFLISIIVLIVLAVVLPIVIITLSKDEGANDGEIEITFNIDIKGVMNNPSESEGYIVKGYKVKADSGITVADALIKVQGIIVEFKGDKVSEFGRWLESINGIDGNFKSECAWMYDINGEYAEYGIDLQKITQSCVVNIYYKSWS